MNSGLPPTFENCKIIATAFGLPIEEVLRRAELLPMSAGGSLLEELIELESRLTPEGI